MSPCWERQSHMHSLPSPSGHIRMGLGPGTLRNQEIKSPHSLFQSYRLMWEYLSLFEGPWMFLLPGMCINGPQAYPLLSAFQIPQGRDGGPSCGTRRIHAGQLFCIGCQEGNVMAMGDQHTTGADILLYVSKIVVPSSAWLHCAFFGDSNIKTQLWLLFLMVDTVMISAFLHVVGFLPWHWEPVQSVLLDIPLWQQ